MAILNVGGRYYDDDPATNTGGSSLSKFGKWLTNRWNDITGQTAIDKQNEANMQMAKYQTQVQEELYKKYSSPEAIMKQLQAAGLNPNLTYSAATGGQGNVPGFQAPNVERGLTSSQKFDQALSKMASVLNLKQMVYQTDAAREDLNSRILDNDSKLISNRRNWFDFTLDTMSKDLQKLDMYDSPVSGNYSGSVRGSINGTLPQYIQSARESAIAKLLEPALSLRENYGFDAGTMNKLSFDGIQTIRRNQAALDYEIDQDYKAMLKRAGIAGPLIQGLLRILAK